MSQLPLSGLTVVSLEQAVATSSPRVGSPTWARVIKIERPGMCDFARTYDEAVLGQFGYFLWIACEE